MTPQQTKVFLISRPEQMYATVASMNQLPQENREVV